MYKKITNNRGKLSRYTFKFLFMIKVIAIILLTGILQAKALNSFAQKITINEKNVSLIAVLTKIGVQSGYDVVYNRDALTSYRVAELNLKGASVEQALKASLANLPLSFIIEDKMIMIRRKVQVVDKTIETNVTGTIRDSLTKESLPGVNIRVKGKSISAISTPQGTFSIKADMGDVIVFSYIGFKTKEVLVNQNNLSVLMQVDDKKLEDVVVIGYGTKKKIHLTGSVATVSGKELTEAPSSNLSNMIAGRLSGVVATNPNGRPGSGSNLNIRGFSTLGNNSPLIIVDGVQRDSFNAFDPNEIESISVLKDAAATAVYGARANNGVFLVTTKRGKIGKPSISYSGNTGIQQPTLYPKVMSAAEYAKAYNQGLLNAGFDPNNPAQAGNFFKQEAIGRYERGEDGEDWYKATFKKNPLITNHNLTVNGGTEAIKYFLSLGTVDQSGMYDNISYKAYKFRSNIDAKINNSLSVGIDLEGRQENNETPRIDANTIFEHVVRANPTYRAYFPSGRPVNNGGDHVGEEIKNSGYNRLLQNTFQGTLSATQKLDVLTEGLSAQAKVSFGKQYGFRKAFSLPYAMYNEDADGKITGTKTVGPLPSLSETFNQSYSTFFNASLNYQRKFGKHDFSGLLLYEDNESQGDQFNAFKQDFPIVSKDEFFVSGPKNQSISGSSLINDARRALVGRIGYVFNDRYLLDASFRYDGSYIFPEGKRFGFFPAVSAGWRISEEDFIKNNPSLAFITNLKIRGSKGLVGNDKVSAFQFQDAFTLATNAGPFFNGVPQALTYYGVYPNPDITWEKADNTNIGFEANLWNNKLGIEFDYFIKDTRDILWSRTRSVPGTFGRSLPNENYARVLNKGIDLVLSHESKIGSVNYNLKFISSYAKNRVKEIDDPANAQDFQKQINRPLGFRVGYEALGFFQSQAEADNWMGGKQFGLKPLPGQIKYADLNGDGTVDSNDQKVLSDNTPAPRVMLGLSGGLNWKGFDLNFLLQGAAAMNFLYSTNGRIPFQGGIFHYMLDAWSPTNTGAEFPSLVVGAYSNNDRTSSVWLKDASYLRLKSLNIGYTFSKIAIKTFELNRLRVFASGFNLVTWSKLKNFDPEAENGAGNYYPQQRVFSFGVNINF